MLRPQFGLFHPGSNGSPCWLGQFELNWSLCFSLHDHRPRQNLISVRDVADFEIDEIASSQLAIDGQIEHRQISNLVFVLKVYADRP